MNKKEYIKLRIETKLIGKIAHHRLMVRKTFGHRHIGDFPDIGRSQCMHHVNELRVWLRIAQLIDEARYKMRNSFAEPYETYYAKQLTK